MAMPIWIVEDYLWLLINWSTASWIMILVIDGHALEARFNCTNGHYGKMRKTNRWKEEKEKENGEDLRI